MDRLELSLGRIADRRAEGGHEVQLALEAARPIPSREVGVSAGRLDGEDGLGSGRTGNDETN